MRLIQAMIKLVVGMMVTALVCVVCTFTVMNAYLDMILDQYQLKSSAMAAPSWSQFMTHLGKQAEGFHLFADGKSGTGSETLRPNRTDTGAGMERETPPNDAVAVFGHQKNSDMKTEPRSNSGSSIQPQETKPSGPTVEAKPSTPSTSDSQSIAGSTVDGMKKDSLTDSGAGGKVVVSGEEFTKKKEQLSNEDKNQIFKLLTRVPQSEIQQISSMMEDGITAIELQGIEKVLQNYLKPEEYSQLLGMIESS